MGRRRTPGRRERISFLGRIGQSPETLQLKSLPEREGHIYALGVIGRSAWRAAPQRRVALPIAEGEHEGVKIGALDDHGIELL